MGHQVWPVFPTKLTIPLSNSPVDNHNFLGTFEFLVQQCNKSPCGEKGRGQQTVWTGAEPIGSQCSWLLMGRALKVLSAVKHLWQWLLSTTGQWPVCNQPEHTGLQSPLYTKALTIPLAHWASLNPCYTVASGIGIPEAQRPPWTQPADKTQRCQHTATDT